MKYQGQDDLSNDSQLGSAEATLRLIASLPAPAGLEERVQAGLRAAPRSGRVLAWPAALSLDSNWMRAAAAAAIVFVVAGGGWGVYAHVQPGQSARGVAVPPHVAAPAGGFSNSGAMRTPNTLNGPLAPHPATARPPAKASVKGTARTTQTPLRPGKSGVANKAVPPPVAPAAK
jgi:hypothetical protein